MGVAPGTLPLHSRKPSLTCVTAEHVVADAERIAVGCSPIGTDPPTVQFHDLDGSPGDAVALERAPAQTDGITWPVIDVSLERAATVADGKVWLWSLADGHELAKLELPAPQATATELVFSGAGDRLAVARKDGRVALFDLGDLAKAPQDLAPDAPDQEPEIAFSTDGKQLGVATFLGSFFLYETSGVSAYAEPRPGDAYGRNGVAPLGEDWWLQLEAGQLVVRDRGGKRHSGELTSKRSSPGLMGPVDLGALDFVTSRGDRAALIAGDGLTVTVLRLARR